MAAPQPIRSQSYEQIYALVQQSIANRQPLAAVYNNRRRLLCPYLLGRNKLGELRALCYQIGGESGGGLRRRGSEENWRCVNVEKLVEVELANEPWFTPPNYSPHQTCIETVEAAVEEKRRTR